MRSRREILDRLHTLQDMRDHPPRVVFYDGENPPYHVDLTPGAQNYFITNAQDEKILVDIPAINAEITVLTWVLGV